MSQPKQQRKHADINDLPQDRPEELTPEQAEAASGGWMSFLQAAIQKKNDDTANGIISKMG